MNSKNEIPSPLIELFTRNIDIHNYNTRHSKDVHIQSRKSDQTSRSFLHQSPKLWLTIPEVIKNAKSLASTISQGNKIFFLITNKLSVNKAILQTHKIIPTRSMMTAICNM